MLTACLNAARCVCVATSQVCVSVCVCCYQPSMCGCGCVLLPAKCVCVCVLLLVKPTYAEWFRADKGEREGKQYFLPVFITSIYRYFGVRKKNFFFVRIL